MQDTIFREYDIRGKIDSEFNIEQTYNLTRAIISYLKSKNPTLKTVVVGMDGRLSSPIIKEHINAALCDYGLQVIFIGICPSPVLYFALHTMNYDVGLMITASHNPKDYNGIKILLGTKTIWGSQIKEIGAFYKEKKFLPLAQKKGSVQEKSIIQEYITWLFEHFSSLVAMPLSLVIDCGNGTAGTVLPSLINKMRWKNVTLLCVEVDGTYPHHEADPTVAKNMIEVKEMLATTPAVFGAGLDGDCDRMGAMTKSGFLVPGDQLLALFVQDIIKNNPETSVVFDIKASLGLLELLEKWHVKGIMCPCGHAIIKECMDESNAAIGGELSCHFFFNDRHFGYDDGIYALLRLIEIIHKTQKPLDELIKIFPKKYSSPEIRLETSHDIRQTIIEQLKKAFEKQKDVQISTIDGIRVTLPYGWGNVRSSNTQPVLSMRFEGNSASDLVRIKMDFIALLIPFFNEDYLKKVIL